MTLDDLRKIAENANVGDWNNGPPRELPPAQMEADAEFITTFNPAKVLELLDQIEQLQAVVRDSHDNCTYQTRLAAVEKLHSPVEIEPSDTICGHCSFQLPNGKYFGKIVEYPCDTIKAVRGE